VLKVSFLQYFSSKHLMHH